MQILSSLRDSSTMNHTALASLISQCVRKILEKNLNASKNATMEKTPKYKPYDNAYFFILFVMLFYSFLALTVFFGYVRSKKAISKKDPYQEFIEDKDRSKKWNTSRPEKACCRRLSWPESQGCCMSFGLCGHVPEAFSPDVSPTSMAGILRGCEVWM
uniref:Uncharacterized protein n=1 Tax=Anolis carolinensis TaxID=28377 RepID=A0A803SWG2_ANOCA